MTKIKEDIQAAATRIVEYFRSDRILLDYSIDSFRSIDIFFDQYNHNGKTSQDIEQILFSLGAYVGETILKNVPGSAWVNEMDASHVELDAFIKLPNGKTVSPFQKVAKRFQQNSGDSIYEFGATILKEITRENYWSNVKNTLQYGKSKISGKTRWRFG